MFLPYSSDIYEEYSPWMGYIVYFAAALIAFRQLVSRAFPETHRILFGVDYFNIRMDFVLLIMFYMASLLFFWVFGKSVCSKIGNFSYLFIMGCSAGLYFLIQGTSNAPLLWFFSWTIHAAAGMYLIFWPVNSIDCFITFILPRTFSLSGFWVILYWIILDGGCCLLFERSWIFFINLSSFLAGMLLASLLICVRWAVIPRDESSFWDILLRRNQSLENETWQYSWADRKTHQQRDEEVVQAKDKALQERQHQMASVPHHSQMLCRCGQVVTLSPDQTSICPSCGRRIQQVPLQ